MKTFAVTALGCKVNQYESSSACRHLRQLGLEQVKLDASPDIVVVHTCCVTCSASSKSRQAVARALKLNPSARVIAAGCLATIQDQECEMLHPAAIAAGHHYDLPSVINTIVNGEYCDENLQGCIRTEKLSQIKNKKRLTSPNNSAEYHPQHNRCRAFLKVQDGCDGHCTYCIIPKVRQNVCSVSEEDLIAEARGLIDEGYREIVLTGIFLGAWGRDTVIRRKWSDSRSLLAGLVARLAALEGLHRLRLSSLEPGDVTDELIDVLADNPRVASHLHLPLQSGCDRTLRRMARQYRLCEYLATIDRLRARLDRPAITTDIIAGFPDESQLDFNETMRVAESVGFAKIHVFGFSLRKGTPAEKLPGHLPPAVIHDRVAALNELDARLQQQYRRQFAGEIVSVIIEKLRPPTGRCERYFSATFPDAQGLHRGDIVAGRLAPDGITARIC